MTETALPAPPAHDPDRVLAWVTEHLGHLCAEGPDAVVASGRFRGGQSAADAALATYDVTGYARQRNEVWPQQRRGASALSPYIRHGLLSLPRVWSHVGGGPSRDVGKFRDELMWQEWSRHLYARLGRATADSLRYDAPAHHPRPAAMDDPATRTAPWSRDLACLDLVVGELETDGWLVNQTRMWLASHWTVREGWGWKHGEDAFFTHLLDGSRAANRSGWQWAVGAGSSKPYGFSRWQVEKRAPGLCGGCALKHDCPIQQWPDADAGTYPKVEADPLLRSDPDPGSTAGPRTAHVDPALGDPEVVWLTAESLGDEDPALAAHPDLPVVFVLDAPLLSRLRLSSKRLVFLAETLAEIGDERDLQVHLGDPVEVLSGSSLAVTHAPVPGFRSRAARLDVAVRHPWPWLTPPHGGAVASFSAWRRKTSR